MLLTDDFDQPGTGERDRADHANSELGIFCLLSVVGIVMVIAATLRTLDTEMAVTNKRVIIKPAPCRGRRWR